MQDAIEKDGDFVTVLARWKEVLGEVLPEFLEMERDNQIGVEKYERDDAKRFGTRERRANTETIVDYARKNNRETSAE